MDREDLDEQLKKDGAEMVQKDKGSSAGRKRLAAMAAVLIFAGFAGGCLGGGGDKKGASSAPAYSFPQAETKQETQQKKQVELPAIRNNAIVEAVKKAGPAVVGITTRVYDRDIFNRRVEVGQSTGSGVIFDKQGYIVTNNHVVSGSSDVNVSLSSGETVSGKVVGTDPSTDLAVVKIDSKSNLPVAEFGDSDALQVGETAIAIGNPLGMQFSGSVTVGVISAMNRSLEDIDQRFPLIQTDAAINPGNSGGALVTADGKVVGINSAKIAQTGVEGMGFAIPINQAKTIISQLIDSGKVSRAYLGVYGADKDIAQRYGYQWDHDGGILVMKVVKNGPLSTTDIRMGDYIISLDGKAVNTMKEMRAVIDAHKPGDVVKIVYEHNGKKVEDEIMLAQAPETN